MPELPDLTVYLDALGRVVVGHRLERIRVASPSLLRTVEPPLTETYGKTLREVHRIGKRLVFGLEGDLFLVLHLMIAGRLHWKPAGARLAPKVGLAAFDFPHGTLLLTETGTRKRAALHTVRGEQELAQFNQGGLEPLEADLPAFRVALKRENHTLKRAMTDPRLFAGIGNAYSDEILYRAKLSPVTLTRGLNDAEVKRLFEATQAVLSDWIARLRAEVETGFPEKVTAFRDGMAVHGRYGRPCPLCGSPVQRIVYAENEANYCATCQTGGKLLADRALSRLLKSDWPKTLEEQEARRSRLKSDTGELTS